MVVLPHRAGSAAASDARDAEAQLAEAVSLAEAIRLDVVAAKVVRLRSVQPATLFGSGQVGRLADEIAEAGAEILVLDGALTPIQQRNLERRLNVKVIDRTGLILEIFGDRARTREGSLQVELAHLDYQASRLVRSWTHLERQRGGFGFLGGPGETQIETDRRLIRNRMAKLRRELEDVRRTRTLHRRQRQKAPYPVVALVGYTNAGKSTLFNRLTGGESEARDMLFATLDPTMRAVGLPGLEKVILSDTVGFVSALPTQLVAAFRATLEEVTEADLIVHVRDVAHPDSSAQLADVAAVLADLGVAAAGEGGAPIVEVLNKIDLLDAEERERLLVEVGDDPNRVAVSAVSGEGIDRLRQLLAQRLTSGDRVYDLLVDAGDGSSLAWLHQHGDVLRQSPGLGTDLHLLVRLSARAAARYRELSPGSPVAD